MSRGDGLLNHNLLSEDIGPQDACGVFGVWAPGEEVAKLTYFGPPRTHGGAAAER